MNYPQKKVQTSGCVISSLVLRGGSWVNYPQDLRSANDPNAPLKVLRHVAYNLDDKHFKGSPLEKHLVAKGKMTAMTKAASHLLLAEEPEPTS